MELWVVAAAAGAGYLAKYWQNIIGDNKSRFCSRSSVPYNPLPLSLVQEQSDKTCTTGSLSPRNTADQYLSERSENCTDDTFAEKSRRGGPTTTDVPSASILHHIKQTEKHEDDDMPSSSGFQPEFGKYENYGYESGYGLGSDLSDIPENNIWNTGLSDSGRRSRTSWRSNRLRLPFIKPRSSLDSCPVAQMNRGHGSPCSPLRLFCVTDGTSLIGRASNECKPGLHMEDEHLNARDGVVGVRYFSRIQAANYSKQKINKVKNQMENTSNNGTLLQYDSQYGSPSGQFLFCLGISIGMMYTIIVQKMEVEKLKESLEQSELIVQDLQEELEMKDSLIVKELVIDDSSQDAHETLPNDEDFIVFSSQADANVLMRCADDSVSLEEVESMSKIEAELEAELERLEVSMKGTTLQGMLSGAIELEHDFDEDGVAELVHGELRADLRRKSSSEPTPDRGSTPPSAKNGVSPHELSLRLHEVIESRLKRRIMELEAELSRTQKRVQHLESEKVNSWRDFWNSESSSNPSTPIVVEAHSPVMQPLVMNLSGDALDAYNEACEELSMIKGFQNEDPIQANGPKDDQLATHKVSCGKQNGIRYFDMKIAREEPMSTGRVRIPFDERSTNLDEGSPNRNEENSDDDDLRLIKQIVEKARQGSPAILRAKRALVCLERRE